MRLLHVVPDSAVAPQQRYLGSTKDIRGRTEYLEVRGIEYDEVPVVRSDHALRSSLESLQLKHYDVILIELATYPRSMAWLRRIAPWIRQLVRPTNAAFLQQLHLARLAVHLAQPHIAGVRQSGLELLRAARRIQKEFLSASRSDCILAITDWERTTYWERLTTPSKVVTVPYFLPRRYGESRVSGWRKEDHCVCLTSSNMNPFLLDAVRNFERVVQQLRGRCASWHFFITGDLATTNNAAQDRIVRAGFVGDLGSVLGHARAIALLSDYGVGFKTKVLDAIRHECFMLVTPPIYERMPVEVRPFCIAVDPTSPESFAHALNQCRKPYPVGDPNETFRGQAFRALDALIRKR